MYKNALEKKFELPTLKVVPDALDVLEVNLKPLRKGWALQQKRAAVRFTPNQKRYLPEIFDIGIERKKKSDHNAVAEEMKTLRNENGNYRFTTAEWLKPSQILSFWSRESKYRRDNGITETDRNIIDQRVGASDTNNVDEHYFMEEPIIEDPDDASHIVHEAVDSCNS